MSELVHSLGIEWKVLIAQVLNFAILFFVLKRFALGPILSVLEKREKKVHAAEEYERSIAAKLEEIKSEKEKVLDVARHESVQILKQAEVSAKNIIAEARVVAEAEAAKIISAGKRLIADERMVAEGELKREIGTLLADTVEKAVGSALDKRAHAALVEEAKVILIAKDRS